VPGAQSAALFLIWALLIGALAWIVERSPDAAPGGDRH